MKKNLCNLCKIKRCDWESECPFEKEDSCPKEASLQKEWDSLSPAMQLSILCARCNIKDTEKILEGISYFSNVDQVVKGAEKLIQEFTRSNFSKAHFYEKVRTLALKIVYGSNFGRCITCSWYKNKCTNESNDPEIIKIFNRANMTGYGCKYYYPS